MLARNAEKADEATQTTTEPPSTATAAPRGLGDVLLIANPTAQNGKGSVSAYQASRLFYNLFGEEHFRMVLTEHPRHATELAAQAGSCNTVLALGGDGVIHETVGGLMRLREEARPVLGIIPIGSGNDYARSLGIKGSLDELCSRMPQLTPQPVDIGMVNGIPFMETLSFGLDAAIALDTVQRRVHTGHTGTRLYMESGFDQLMHHLDMRNYTLSADSGPEQSGSSLTFAVQIGPYYGGGFKVCPEAELDDGLFDVCIAHNITSVPRAVRLFLKAKNGHHVGAPEIEQFRCAALSVRFPQAPPTQVDGEALEATAFDISLAPRALRVLRP